MKPWYMAKSGGPLPLVAIKHGGDKMLWTTPDDLFHFVGVAGNLNVYELVISRLGPKRRLLLYRSISASKIQELLNVTLYPLWCEPSTETIGRDAQADLMARYELYEAREYEDPDDDE